MDLATIAHLTGVPGLGAAVALLKSTASGIENVKVYKQQCSDLRGRCLNLMVALRDGSPGLEGTKVLEIADEIEMIMQRIDRKVREWGSMSQLRSFLSQREIKDGIDSLYRDIDEANMKFSIMMNMEIARGHIQSRAIQERDKAEMRDLLQHIVRSTDDMKLLLNMQSSRDSHPVEEIMESLQTELMDPSLDSIEEEVFKAGLWELHEKTSKLPPLTDLTGQVDIGAQVAKGSFNDIYRGRWLDKEPVALRLPRTLANSPEDQRDFQQEVSLWRGLDHPNVTPLYGVIYKNDNLYSVSPWMDNGPAPAYVKKNPTVDRLKLLTDTAMGLEYLHNKGIVHGDIKGANLLISKDGTARLSDFGFSKFLEDCGKGMGTANNINPRWFAPELLRQTGPVSTHSDVWSFGMLCLEILSGDVPYAKISRDIAVLREVDNGKLPDHPGRMATNQGLSDDMWNLMHKCWHQKPEARPSITDVKNSLLEIRGLIRPVADRSNLDTKPAVSRMFGIFSKPSSRPRTAESDRSGMSSLSQRSRNGISSNSIREADELSPLDGSFRGFDSAYPGSITHRNSRQNSVSSQTPSTVFDRTLPHTAPPMHARSSSSYTASRSATLEVPQSSSLPTSFGTYIPERSASHDSHGKGSPIKSVLSSDSSAHLTGPVREAVTDPRIIVNVNEAGMVISGTLEGLVQRLITNFNSRKDAEFRDVLLTACADFTTPEDLFGVLSRRFYEVESDPSHHPEDRVALQYNIFMAIMYWLSNRHLPVDHQLLWQMRNFCENAIRMKSSATMSDKARDLLNLVDTRHYKDSFTPPLSPGRPKLSASQITPSELAIALTLMEGDKYKILVPSDYIAHLRRHPGYNNLEGAYTTNNKIVYWVKDSILHYEKVEQRADVLKFFIHTAQECRKRRNFSSLVAIASALHSAPIERLRLTRAALTVQMQNRLNALENLINPSSNHRGYREALNDAPSLQERDQCIPWLAVHLKELHAVLQRYPTTVQVHARPLINFERYVKFMDRIREVVHYKPPNLEQYRHMGQLDYLETQLRNLKMSPHSDDQMMTRSRMLEARETLDYRTRRPQLKTLGFRTT